MAEGYVASVNSEIPIVITTDQNIALIESNHLSNALEVDNDLCQILVPKKNDHQILIARTSGGKLIVFCYLTMMELFEWSDDKVTDIVLIEDENDPILKLLMVVQSTNGKTAGETFLQIVQYPNFDLLYRLKVTSFCKLLDISLNQETPLFVEGSFEAPNDENSDLNVSKNDLLTAITYDKTGKYLAVGDQGGRVIIFKYNELKNSRYFDYRYFTEIQSHEPEFDHLKSIELDEKINAIEFVNNK